MGKKKTFETEQMFGDDVVLTEDEINFLDNIEPFEDFIPNKINGFVSGFLVGHEQDNIDDFMVNTAGVVSDVTCGAINITEGILCEGVDLAAHVTKRGINLTAGLSRTIVKTFMFGYSKNKRKYGKMNVVNEG
jgi:hypothetical protein